MRVVIVGCGYVGSRLAEELLASGHEVWGVRRRGERLPAGVGRVAADVTRPESLVAMPPQPSAVVYCVSADAATEEAYRAAYVDGLRHVLGLLSRRGERPRVLFTSSTAVYHQDRGEWVDEESPAEPVRFTGKLVLEGEELLRRSGFPVVVLRLAGIYGPGRERLIEAVERGEATCREDPPHYTNRVHRDDCAGAAAHFLELPAARSLYVVADDEPAPECEVLDWLAVRLAAPRPRRVAWRSRARAATSKRCRNARLRASGYRLRYPTYRDGYEALLRRRARHPRA